MRKDLKQFNIEEESWFRAAQERAQWRAACREGLSTRVRERLRAERARRGGSPVVIGPTASQLVCNTCHRSFRRQ